MQVQKRFVQNTKAAHKLLVKLTQGENGRIFSVAGMPGSFGTNILTLSPDGWKTSSVNLPNNLESSCTVSINDTTIIIMGGFWYTNGGISTSQTFFYNVETDILTPGPELNEGRTLSACSMMKDSTTGVNFTNIFKCSFSTIKKSCA
jgi:hypothetical protein